jgi:hypothetical protein
MYTATTFESIAISPQDTIDTARLSLIQQGTRLTSYAKQHLIEEKFGMPRCSQEISVGFLSCSVECDVNSAICTLPGLTIPGFRIARLATPLEALLYLAQKRLQEKSFICPSVNFENNFLEWSDPAGEGDGILRLDCLHEIPPHIRIMIVGEK